LVAGLGGHPEDASAAQSINAEGAAGLAVIASGIEGKADGNFLALLEDLASGFLSGDDQEFDLAQAERAVGIITGERKDLLSGLQDGGGNEGRAVGALSMERRKRLSSDLASKRCWRSFASICLVRIMQGTSVKPLCVH
jgi:hypothetical protein